jgi:hyaluronoglucosaminidase
MVGRHNSNRRNFLKWMATTGVAATGFSAPVGGTSGGDPSTRGTIPHVIPTPQRIQKQEKSFPITPVVTLVTSSSVDPAVLQEVKTVLRAAGVREIRKSEESGQPRGPLAVYIGKPTKTRVGEALDQMNVTFPDDLPNEGYVLATGHAPDGKRVVLAGADSTGTFHAAQTLRQLVIEHPGRKRLPGVTITDYPEMPIRGTIEGFYGPPWSHEDRLRQLEFYGDVKNNTYVYAPKDDPYHREKWREPYPSDELEKLGKLVDRARQNHVDFTFALSPGQSICYTSESDFQALIDKFESMYDIGVRSFYIAFDDIDYTDWVCTQDPERFGTGGAGAGKAQAYLLNRVQRQFVEAHEDVERLWTVPTEYYNVAESPYKEALRENLDPEVIVQWTGIGVIADEITQEQTEAAHTVFGHDIAVWDNYPVNDYIRERLFLGPLTGREPGLDKHGLIGLTSNPLNEAEASKIALATAADYTWNSDEYDPKQSWELSLKRFGDDAYETLHTFAENTRSTPLKGSLSESPELLRLIDEFWQAYETGNLDPEAQSLAGEFATIEQAPDRLRAELENQAFLEEVQPWLKEAELTGIAGQSAVTMLASQQAGNGEEAWRTRQSLRDVLKQRDDNPKTYAPGVADPFFRDTLAANNRWLGATDDISPTTTLGTYADYVPAHMVDSDLDTFYWSNEAPNPGDFVGVDLNEVHNITEIDIMMAKPTSPNDYIHEGVLEVSTDGKTWTSLGEFSDQSEISVTAPNGTKARYIRLRVTSPHDFWLVVREFSVAIPDNVQLRVSGNPPPVEDSSLSYTVDGQPETAYEAARAPQPGEVLEIAISSLQSLDQLIVLQDSDKAATGKLQVRTDDGWTTIGSLDEGYTEIDTGGVETDTVRLAWAEDSPTPVIHEIIPGFDEEP